jgi:putative ABC transport system permease protein
MLAWRFLRLVGIAFLFAIPLAWFGLHRWLQDFVYRVEIGWQLPAITGAIILLVALLTVSYHSVKAAWTNPADALRYE